MGLEEAIVVLRAAGDALRRAANESSALAADRIVMNDFGWDETAEAIDLVLQAAQQPKAKPVDHLALSRPFDIPENGINRVLVENLILAVSRWAPPYQVVQFMRDNPELQQDWLRSTAMVRAALHPLPHANSIEAARNNEEW